MDRKLKDNKEEIEEFHDNDRNNNETNSNVNKQYKKPYLVNIIAFLIIIAFSVGILSIYPTIKEKAKANISSPYENYEILKRINQTNYILYKNILDKEESKELTYDETYVKSYKESKNYNQFKHNLNNEIEGWNENLNRRLKNLDYFAYVNNDFTKNKTNIGNSLSRLVTNSKNEELNDKYDFFMVVHYDKNGGVEVSNIHGANEYNVRNIFSEFSFKRSFDNNLVEVNEIKFNEIKNATFIYAIPKELKYEDNISVILNRSLNNVNIEVLITIVMMILCSILLLGLMVPYKKGKDVFGIKMFIKIPLEINCIIFAFGVIFSGIGSFYSVCATIKGSFGKGWIGFGINPELDMWLRSILNVTMWFIVFYLIFAGDMLLKHIFKTGIVKYLKEKLLIIKIFKVVKKWMEIYLKP
ncbi:MAG: hypothetical protein LLF98_12040 [Clostridium sp.]|uniref:hypothetical protein n=1 Tax=Clostridium sp. TaxID=1506 RepID=UPI0025C38F97|nr:hypothetical protein [Clostridium sp.]MCE5221958.1 hypothetical protein [Clostridium sp.]